MKKKQYKFKCVKCGKTPKEGWYYMPSTDNTDYFYCDNCVPRGCTCNQDLKEGIDYESDEAKKPENWIDVLDEKGRKLPCCEYWWVDNEHDYEQRFSLDNPNHPDNIKE